MSTRAIAAMLVILLIIAGFLFFGGTKQQPVPQNMPQGMMENSMNMNVETTSGVHTMPDGTTMDMDGMHMMPDGTMMSN
jgi:hypothetical protein